MALVPETLDGGLVTARDPAMLKSGELALANNVHYKPHDRGLHKTRQRTKYNATPIPTSPVVKGLRYAEFDTGDPLLVALVNDDLYLSTITDETGTFGTLSPILGVGSGTSLDAAQFEDNYYLFTGVDENQVLRADRSVRRHGMNSVQTMGPTAPALISGVFNSNLGTGFFYFLVTEVSDPDTEREVESAFTGTPKTTESGGVPVALTSPSSQAIRITQPPLTNIILVESVTANGTTTLTSAAGFSKVRVGQLLTGTGVPVNTYVQTVTDESTIVVTNAVTGGTITVTFYIATHWRIYMAPVQEAAVPPALSLFRRVAQQEISILTVDLGSKTNGERFPTASTVHTGGWANIARAHTIDGLDTTSQSDGAKTGYHTFGFSSTGTIIGIEVRVRYRTVYNLSFPPKSYPLILLNLSTNANSGTPTLYRGDRGYILQARSTNQITVVAGSPTDLWGKAGGWSTAEINAAGFGMQLRYGLEQPNLAGMELRVDAVSIIVYTSGGTNDPVNLNGQQYRTVSISVAGLTSIFSQALPPPIATTGDVYEDTLVTNDISNKSAISYSMAGRMHYFPAPFYLNFETKVADEVTLVRRVGNKLIVGAKAHLFRVNYLPRETDSEFDRGRPWEPISESHGCVGRQAAAVFNPDDTAMILAVVSHTGVHMTDGFTSTLLSGDLDWPNTVRLPVAGDATNYLENSILVDYPNLQVLAFYYTPPGQTTNTKALYFHYNKYHRKEDGTFKVTGPIDVAARSACVAKIAGNTVMVTGQTSGTVYVEDRGFSDASGSTPTVEVRTRELYPAGMASSCALDGVYVRHRQSVEGGAGGSTATVQPLTRDGDAAQSTAIAGLEFTTANAGIAKVAHKETSDSFQLKITEPGGTSGLVMEALMLDLESKGSDRSK